MVEWEDILTHIPPWHARPHHHLISFLVARANSRSRELDGELLPLRQDSRDISDGQLSNLVLLLYRHSIPVRMNGHIALNLPLLGSRFGSSSGPRDSTAQTQHMSRNLVEQRGEGRVGCFDRSVSRIARAPSGVWDR